MKNDVLIIGGGPVGLMTALGLAREGIQVTLLEAEQEISYTPRAISYAWPIFSGLQLFGVLEDMMDEGQIVDKRSWRHFKTGETVTYDHTAVRDLTDYPYSLTLGQDRIGKILVKHLQRYPNVTIHWGTAFSSVNQTSDRVTVTAQQANEDIQFEADWVVAADGGRSAVRKSLGVAFEGFTWPERFIATDIHYDFDQYGWNSGYLVDPVYGAVVYKLTTDNLWRVTFAESTGLDADSVAERIPAFMKTILPGEKTYQQVLYSPYNMHQRTARNYRHGRVMLAGDAAHVTNPTSGFGLMGGLYDAFCLSEALAAVVQLKTDQTVLDHYASLRRKVYLEVTSPVSSESKRLVFNCPDPERLQWDFTLLKERMEDFNAMQKFLSVPAALETLSLLTGQTLAQRCQKKA